MRPDVTFDKAEDWRRHGVYGDGQLLCDNYRWLISFYVLGFHIMLGRSAWTNPFKHRRFWCWLKTGHTKETNNPDDPERRWWCRGCGTVWPE
jgi:hypothetical protein